MRTLIVFLLLCHSMIGFGQILKVDKLHLEGDSSGYITGVVDAAFAANNRSSTAVRQNVYLGITSNLDLVHIGKENATIMISGINFYKLGDGPFINTGFVHFREVLNRKQKWNPEIFTQAQYDESRNMRWRLLMGGGYRWNIFRGKNALHLGLGAFREHERWEQQELLISKRLWKMNSYLGGELMVTKSIGINSIVYFQSGYDREDGLQRNRLSGSFQIRDKLTEHLKAKLVINFLVDDEPIVPLNRVVYETFVGFEYRL
jgi:hypothetical protein